MRVFSSHILLLSTDETTPEHWAPSAGEVKLLRKSNEVPLRLGVGSVCLLQGKAGVAESVCPKTSLPQSDFIDVPEGRVKRGLSQALLGVLWWDQANGCKLKQEIPLEHQEMFFTLPDFP